MTATFDVHHRPQRHRRCVRRHARISSNQRRKVLHTDTFEALSILLGGNLPTSSPTVSTTYGMGEEEKKTGHTLPQRPSWDGHPRPSALDGDASAGVAPCSTPMPAASCPEIGMLGRRQRHRLRPNAHPGAAFPVCEAAGLRPRARVSPGGGSYPCRGRRVGRHVPAGRTRACRLSPEPAKATMVRDMGFGAAARWSATTLAGSASRPGPGSLHGGLQASRRGGVGHPPRPPIGISTGECEGTAGRCV